MKLQTWKIQGRAFHFGEHGIGQEESRINWTSDSLFAALVSRLAITHGNDAVEEWLGTSEQPRTPPFLLTSTFPFAGNVRFFPVPKAALRNEASDWRPKKLKKIRFVSESIYRTLLAGNTLSAVFNDKYDTLHEKTVLLRHDEFNSLPEAVRKDPQSIWALEKRPRVAVGRFPNNSNLFHVGAVRFSEACGLWFGVAWLNDNDEQRALLQALLEDLGDAGLGAERTSGYGHAKITKAEPIELPDPNGGMWTTLSRYLPTEDEIPALQNEKSVYQITRVGGWMDGRGLRRRAVNLLQEGAVLAPIEKKPPYGFIADTRPQGKNIPAPHQHPVWRSGLTVAVGYGGGDI